MTNITLEEATEATDQALRQCIEELEGDLSLDQRERDRLIDILLETRQKSIETLMSMSLEQAYALRKYQNKITSLIKYIEPRDE